MIYVVLSNVKQRCVDLCLLNVAFLLVDHRLYTLPPKRETEREREKRERKKKIFSSSVSVNRLKGYYMPETSNDLSIASGTISLCSARIIMIIAKTNGISIFTLPSRMNKQKKLNSLTDKQWVNITIHI